MPLDGQDMPATSPLMPELTALTQAALEPVRALLDRARDALRARVAPEGRVSGALVEEHQTAAHGLAWIATYAESLAQMQAWAGRLDAEGRFGEMEALILRIGFGEYLAQIAGGIPMNQGEMKASPASVSRRCKLPAP